MTVHDLIAFLFKSEIPHDAEVVVEMNWDGDGPFPAEREPTLSFQGGKVILMADV